LEALERRVIVQSQCIKEIRLETGEGAYQLEEAGDVPVEELTKVNHLEEEAKHKLSGEIVELEFVEEWQASSTRGEVNKGYQDDLPIDKEEVQQRRLHKES
jgi:hypothetical protein